MPCDITITRNHVAKQLAWAGRGWNVKNLLEIQTAIRPLVQGNVLENRWGEAQAGRASNLTSGNQAGSAPLAAPVDLTVRPNRIPHVCAGFVLTGQTP